MNNQQLIQKQINHCMRLSWITSPPHIYRALDPPLRPLFGQPPCTGAVSEVGRAHMGRAGPGRVNATAPGSGRVSRGQSVERGRPVSGARR